MVTMSNPGMGPDSESAANRTSRFRPQTSLAEELARAQTFTGASGATLASLEGDTLVWLGAVGEHQPKKLDRWSLAGSFANLCLGRRTKPLKCDDTEADGRLDAAFRGLQAKSLALAPVHDADKVTGVLAVFSDNSKAFNGMHVAVLQTQADSMAELLQQARQAAGLQEEEKRKQEEEANRLRLAEQAAPEPVAAPVVPEPAVAPPAPPVRSPQEEFEALESAFVVVPPPVAAAPSAPAAEPAPPVVQATQPAAAPEATPAPAATPLPKLTVVPTPAPSATTPASERPTLPGFMPLSATAAALAKAKPAPPTPPELVVETKTPKPSAPRKPAVKTEPAAVPAAAAPAPPPVAATAAPRPPIPASVPTPPPMPPPAAARPAAPARKPADPPAVKFVPLAKPAEVKTPPPGSLKPPVVPAPQSGSPAKSSSPAKNAEDCPLPAAVDPFAEFSPAFVRAQARTHAAALPSRPTLATMEAVGSPEPASAGLRRLPLVVAVVAAVALGGLWLRTRSHAAQPKPAPVTVQPAPVPAATADVAAAGPAPASPAAATAVPAPASAVPASAPESKPATVTEKPAPVKAVPQAKTQPETAAPKPAATLTAPANLEVKSPTPVLETPRQQEPPPKTQLSLPATASAGLPDLPKPQAANVVRQASIPVPAQLLESVSPVYPPAAKALHLQSVVRLSAKVSAQGKVTDVTWISGNDFFKGSALSAVRQWRYKPASVDGQAVESTVEIVLKFKPQ